MTCSFGDDLRIGIGIDLILGQGTNATPVEHLVPVGPDAPLPVDRDLLGLVQLDGNVSAQDRRLHVAEEGLRGGRLCGVCAGAALALLREVGRRGGASHLLKLEQVSRYLADCLTVVVVVICGGTRVAVRGLAGAREIRRRVRLGDRAERLPRLLLLNSLRRERLGIVEAGTHIFQIFAIF